MVRNPNFDIGQLFKDSDKVENMFLFDGKELYLQIWDDSCCIPYHAESGVEMLQIIVREWRPDSWEVSSLRMIEFPKQSKSHHFGQYLQSLFPQIQAQHLFACRIALMRNFARADLCLKKWFQVALSGTGNQWLGLS